MKKTIVEIYALAVCFVSVIGIFFTLVFGIYDALRLTYPEITLNAWQYEKLDSNQSFCTNNAKMCEHKNEANITQIRESEYKHVLKREQRDAQIGLLFKFIMLSIATIVFILHWWLGARARRFQP